MRGKLREQAIKVLAVDRPRTVTVRAWNFCLWIPGRGTALTVRKPLALLCQVGPYPLRRAPPIAASRRIPMSPAIEVTLVIPFETRVRQSIP